MANQLLQYPIIPILFYLQQTIMKLSLKKSKSLYQKKDTQSLPNPQFTDKTQPIQSHIEEMILQKYNFSHRLKTNIYQKPIKHQSNNQTTSIPLSHVIAVSQLPKIQKSINQKSNQSIFDSPNKIRTTQEQNLLEKSPFFFVRSPPRKSSDYNDCIKRIRMSTTYRGFNFTKAKFHHKNDCSKLQRVLIQKKEQTSKSSLKAAQRKMIIQHIMEKGFARKMEDSLIKVRNEKKKAHYDLISKKNTRATEVLKPKRSVIFSQAQSTPVHKAQTLRNLDGKQQLIEPW